jgi:RNA-directed DNA polymerase
MEETQMNAATRACASPSLHWAGINWPEVQRQVRRLQTRIVKATQVGKHNKVKALQWLLTHSFSGKALAVKRVTENKGKNTPGVDKVTWKTPGAKINAIASLTRRGYSPLPLRRVLIPKKNGKTRPLGIPVMKCRAMQALHLLALEPIAETTSDLNSYGFRPGHAGRSAQLPMQGSNVLIPWQKRQVRSGC